MPTGPFPEIVVHVGEIPDALFPVEPTGNFTGTQDPRVLRNDPRRIRPKIAINILAGARDPDRVVLEGEILGVFDEIKEMGMAGSEFFTATCPIGVMPS